ncbi:hypothetical protein IJ425_07095 [bacterium]|nr:hypothetical protein [bacterium]
MTKKMTKKDYFEILKGAYPKDANNYNEVIEFINHEIELLEKKSSQAKKPTAQQIENENFTSIIKEVLQASEEALTISEIQERDNRLPASNQRMSRLLNNLVESNVLEKTYLKRKPYFKWVG